MIVIIFLFSFNKIYMVYHLSRQKKNEKYEQYDFKKKTFPTIKKLTAKISIKKNPGYNFWILFLFSFLTDKKEEEKNSNKI